MTMEEQKSARLRALEDMFNKGDFDGLDDFTAPDIVYHMPPSPDMKGLDAYKKYMGGVRKAFSDYRLTILQYRMDADGDAALFTIEGTHTGQLPGAPIPPTGRKVTWTGMMMTRIVNGKAVEQWNYADIAGLMQQLGVKP
jgi:predicted ester cyclase